MILRLCPLSMVKSAGCLAALDIGRHENLYENKGHFLAGYLLQAL